MNTKLFAVADRTSHKASQVRPPKFKRRMESCGGISRYMTAFKPSSATLSTVLTVLMAMPVYVTADVQNVLPAVADRYASLLQIAAAAALAGTTSGYICSKVDSPGVGFWTIAELVVVWPALKALNEVGIECNPFMMYTIFWASSWASYIANYWKSENQKSAKR